MAQGTLSQEQLNSNNTNTALQGQTSAMATTGSIAGKCGQTRFPARRIDRGTGTKILGGVLGAAGGLLSAFEDGGIVNQPTAATLGEDGPEAVIPLSGAGGSQDSRPIGGTDAAPVDPFDSPKENTMNFKQGLQMAGQGMRRSRCRE